MRRQWNKGRQKLEKMEENDILKLIQKTGGFDTTNTDNEFNLDQMVQMQDNAAERDACYKKSIATRMEEFWDRSGKTLGNQKSSTSLCCISGRTRFTIRMTI